MAQFSELCQVAMDYPRHIISPYGAPTRRSAADGVGHSESEGRREPPGPATPQADSESACVCDRLRLSLLSDTIKGSR
eukprot:764082-Hanusia_phi.AAC.2